MIQDVKSDVDVNVIWSGHVRTLKQDARPINSKLHSFNLNDWNDNNLTTSRALLSVARPYQQQDQILPIQKL